MTLIPRRSIALFALLTLSSAPVVAAQVVPITEQLEEWYAKTLKTAPGTWGIVVADEAGQVLWSTNATQPMVPASTVKVLTTGFSRTAVGPEARRATRVMGEGAVDAATGTWQGRWALELNGDPTLGRPNRSGPTLGALAQQLHAIGVKRLVGPLALTSTQGEPTASYPTAWSARHKGRSFAPIVGPVTLNENVVAFTMSPGARAGQSPIVTGDAPEGMAALVTVEAKTVAGTRNRLTLSRRGSGWVVGGTIGTRAGARRYTSTAHDATAVVEAAWAFALRNAGIEWHQSAGLVNPQLALTRVLAEVASQPFDSVAHEVNSRSVNIGAELLLLWGAGPNRSANQLERHVKAVTGLNEGINLVDGSGLSDNDRVSPLAFTTYLARFPHTAAGRDFPLLLPANGSGTLRNLGGLPGPGVVRAKTGTLANVTTLVGYLGRADGMLVVAAMYQGSRTTAARQAQWSLFRTLGANGIQIPSDADIDAATSLGS
jgi:D-alanyl-D-alanine carboxypeptidase/D-alanyl-D-alanine-endopeptidase (penicillin-binding protein 4)